MTSFPVSRGSNLRTRLFCQFFVTCIYLFFARPVTLFILFYQLRKVVVACGRGCEIEAHVDASLVVPYIPFARIFPSLLHSSFLHPIDSKMQANGLPYKLTSCPDSMLIYFFSLFKKGVDPFPTACAHACCSGFPYCSWQCDQTKVELAPIPKSPDVVPFHDEFLQCCRHVLINFPHHASVNFNSADGSTTNKADTLFTPCKYYLGKSFRKFRYQSFSRIYLLACLALCPKELKRSPRSPSEHSNTCLHTLNTTKLGHADLAIESLAVSSDSIWSAIPGPVDSREPAAFAARTMSRQSTTRYRNHLFKLQPKSNEHNIE